MTPPVGQTLKLPGEQLVEPFGNVVFRIEPDRSVFVSASILMEHTIEGARAGLAIDGSGTMRPWFGVQRRDDPNIVAPLAQRMCAYLAQKVDAQGRTTAIYWATGHDGRQIEEIGTLSEDEALAHAFPGPINYGDNTYLMPAVQYFVERFRDARWGLYVFITDGRIEDLVDVKAYTHKLARDIAQKVRPDFKLVIIGVGSRIDVKQLRELDNLNAPVDLWDHKIAHTMQNLAEVFAEVVDQTRPVAAAGRIFDPQGNVIKDYRDTGLPALMEFTLPPGSASFTLEIEGQSIVQTLYSGNAKESRQE